MMAKSNSVHTESVGRGGKIMVAHGPNRETFGQNAKEAAMGKDMKDVGLSHSITDGNKVKHY